MNKYKLKVTYKYSDTVEVEAPDLETAKDLAPYDANEEFECLYDVEILEEISDE